MIKNIIHTFKVLHWLGLSLLIFAIGLYCFTSLEQLRSGIVLIACLSGLGMVMMSPFPVALFLQWASTQNEHTK
ncbi:hypothetical protein N9W21_03670 [Shewanella sp.]|nr:hypothetical protein [Shewanella sp.]